MSFALALSQALLATIGGTPASAPPPAHTLGRVYGRCSARRPARNTQHRGRAMEIDGTLIREIGQIAGIGGLALGTLALVFREVIRKNIFPNLTKNHAFQIIRLILILTFSIAALGISAWAFAPRPSPELKPLSRPQKESGVQDELEAHLALIDSARYSDAYDAMSSAAKSRIPRTMAIQSFEQVRKPLGTPLDRKIIGFTPHDRAPDGTPGPFLTVGLITKFQSGFFAEVVTFQAEQDLWRVAGHTAVPCLPPYCNPE
jgi:hypothetical protein